jgi:8-oxo-dGTP pyrophosphatase MutT (NUDIX family)
VAGVIRVSAVVITDPAGRVLTVRKRGTDRFMFPGGKPEPGESPAQTALREAREELGVDLDGAALTFVGTFLAAAANEPGQMVEAAVFSHPFVEVGRPRAEIAELVWYEPGAATDRLAPLLAEHVLPALAAVNATPST